MKLFARLVSRRRRKAHERYLRERARQDELEQQDVQKAIRDVTRQASGNQQPGGPW
jgi:hypothetical protein